MTPAETVARLERIFELIDLGLRSLNGWDDERSKIGRMALKLAKSEVALMKDEGLLADALVRTRVPTIKRPSLRRK